MKSPVTPPPTRKPQDDWLQNCGFQSRQDARNVASGILSQTVEKPHVQPVITPLNDTTVAPGMEIFPLVQAPAPPQKSAGTLDKKVTSELRTFRQLSSGVYCPENSRDSLPEYILFGLLAVLAAVWPVMAMLHAMASHWR